MGASSRKEEFCQVYRRLPLSTASEDIYPGIDLWPENADNKDAIQKAEFAQGASQGEETDWVNLLPKNTKSEEFAESASLLWGALFARFCRVLQGVSRE